MSKFLVIFMISIASFAHAVEVTIDDDFDDGDLGASRIGTGHSQPITQPRVQPKNNNPFQRYQQQQKVSPPVSSKPKGNTPYDRCMYGKSSKVDKFECEVLRLTNIERAKAGKNLKPLEYSPKCNTAARLHAQEWAQHSSKFTYYQRTMHLGLNNSTAQERAEKQGLTVRNQTYGWAENWAEGYMSPASVVRGWMNSRGHKKNILRRSMTHLGVGYAVSPTKTKRGLLGSYTGGGRPYWVQCLVQIRNGGRASLSGSVASR